MNLEKYPVQNYVPINPTKKLNIKDDLDFTLKKMTFKKIVDDPDYHFQNYYVTNFDLIHHECRGDELSHSREHYETIFKKNINDEINSVDLRHRFILSAIRSERKDVFIEKGIFKEHFAREKIEEKLQKKCVFLSSTKKKAHLKKKNDDCKSLMF